jgi:hypothetical protein
MAVFLRVEARDELTAAKFACMLVSMMREISATPDPACLFYDDPGTARSPLKESQELALFFKRVPVGHFRVPSALDYLSSLEARSLVIAESFLARWWEDDELINGQLALFETTLHAGMRLVIRMGVGLSGMTVGDGEATTNRDLSDVFRMMV